MLGLDTLDVGIGMALMFLFVSLICSAIREFGESLLKTRASSLEKGVMEMLGEGTGPITWLERLSALGGWFKRVFTQFKWAPPLPNTPKTKEFYEHPVINALFSGRYEQVRPGAMAQYVPWIGRNGLPSYIPAENFAKAIMQIARKSSATITTIPAEKILNELDAYADQNTTTSLGKAIRTALDTAKSDITATQNGVVTDIARAEATLARTQRAIEQWFNSAMDRVAGWYTRRTAVWLFFLGLGCAAVMNIDAITVMKTLSTDKTLRQEVVGAAGAYLAHCAEPTDPARDVAEPSDKSSSKQSAAPQNGPDTAAESSPKVADDKSKGTASATSSTPSKPIVVCPDDAAANDAAGKASKLAAVASSADTKATEAAAEASDITSGATEAVDASSGAAADASGAPSEKPSQGAFDDVQKKFGGIQTAVTQMNEVSWPIGWSDDWLPAPQERLYLTRHSSLKPAWAKTVKDLQPPKFPGISWRLLVWPFKVIGWLACVTVWLLHNQPLVIVGWLITAFGVTFGASFWFDTLNKFMVVRSTVKPDEKSPKEASKS
jgi:hypothetical protein